MAKDTVEGLRALAGQNNLSPSDFAGMSPKQMLGTARELRQRKANVADTLQAAGEQATAEARTEIQRRGQETAERRTELQEQAQQTDRIFKAMQVSLDKKRAETERKRNNLLNTLTQKRGELTDKKIEQLEQEMEMTDRKMELIDAHKNTDNQVLTNMGKMTPGEMLMYSQMGLDVSPASTQVIDTFTDKEGNVKALTAVPGKNRPQVMDFEDLKGFEPTAEKTEVRMGPREKQAEQKAGNLQAEAKFSQDWRQGVITSFKEANPEYDRILSFSKDQAKIKEAQQALVKNLKNAYENQLNENIEIKSGEEGIGFYGSKSGRIGPLPDEVDSENVIETEGQSTSGYNSPEEVKQAYADGNISKDEAKNILRNNWPDRFE